MQRLKMPSRFRLAILLGSVVFALGTVWPIVGNSQDTSDPANDPKQHSQHKHKASAGDQDLASQIAELHAKVAKLEAALNRDHKDPASATTDSDSLTGAQNKIGGDTSSDRVATKFQNCLQCHRTVPNGPLPSSHLEVTGSSDKGMKPGGMSRMGANKKSMSGKQMGMMGGMDMDMDMDEMKDMGAASPPSGEMKMMDKMMGMMEKMMSGGSMQPMQGTSAKGRMSGMGGGAAPQSVETKMMQKMDRMMGLMEEMMSRSSMQSSQDIPATDGMGDGEPPQSIEMKMMEKMDRMMGLMEQMMSRDSMRSSPGMSTKGAMGRGAPPKSSEMKMMERMMDLMEKMMEGGSMQSGQGMSGGGGGMQDM